jgi:trans-aconitate methyltransferase
MNDKDKSFFNDTLFHTNEDSCRKTTEHVLRNIEPGRKYRILDLGCGQGDHLFNLAGQLPDAELVGVDLSELNINNAKDRAKTDPAGRNITFLLMDYLKATFDPAFDVLFADSSLQNIPASRDELFGKISRDVAPGGLLVISIPFACAFNYALWAARGIFRTVRSKPVEQFIFRVGKVIHGKDFSDEQIKARVIYMFVRTFHYDSRAFRRYLQDKCNFEFKYEEIIPHPSIAQPKHKLLVLRKTG